MTTLTTAFPATVVKQDFEVGDLITHKNTTGIMMVTAVAGKTLSAVRICAVHTNNVVGAPYPNLVKAYCTHWYGSISITRES